MIETPKPVSGVLSRFPNSGFPVKDRTREQAKAARPQQSLLRIGDRPGAGEAIAFTGAAQDD